MFPNFQNFNPLFLFYSISSPIIPTYSHNFIASMIIMSSKDHNTYGNCYNYLRTRCCHISPIIPCNFYCINDNNVHNTHGNCYIGQQDVVIADFSSQFAWNIAVFKYIFTIIIILEIISLHLPIVTSNYSCIMLVKILLFQNHSQNCNLRIILKIMRHTV